MKSKLSFIFLFFFSISFFANAENVQKITINGLVNIDRGTVLSYLPIESGDEAPSKEAEKRIIQALNKTNFFKKVELNYLGSELVINLQENPIIKFIEFKNYKEDRVLSVDIVEDIIENFSLKVGKIFSKNNIDRLLNDLKNLYADNAYYKTTIEVKYDLDLQNRIGIEIIFDEGERALISSMTIHGNNFFPDNDLLDLFDIGEADFFLINWFTDRDEFSRQSFDAGLSAITQKYLDAGFLDIKIIKENVVYNQNQDKLDIQIHINEGTQFKINEIHFTGNLLDFNVNRIRQEITLGRNDIFNRAEIIKGIKSITKLFQDKGFAYTKTTLNVSAIPNSDTLKIVINIDPDSRIFINRITISGNHSTQDDVIRREMKLLEGSLYSKTDLEQSISRIKRLGYFSDVSYELNRHPDKNKMDMSIKVVEQKTGEISIGLSHSNSTGAAINAGISQNNILGTGNVLDARVSNSEAVEELSFYFKNPHINKLGHSLSYGFTSKTINASDLDTSNYILDETSFILGYGVPISQDSNAFSDLKISNVGLTCGYSLKNYDEVGQCNSNDDLDMSLSFSYVENTLNDYYFPTDGLRNSYKLNLGLPVGDFNYYILETSRNSYTPILDKEVLKFATRFNIASGYGGKELPFYKRFFEGGASSIRGFDFNSLGEKYITTGKPRGGELSLVSTLAIGTPGSRIGIDNKNIRLSTFIDAGLIATKHSDFDPGNLRASTGAELTWLTPIGPVGIHYAIPFLKKANDATSSFSFELGTKF